MQVDARRHEADCCEDACVKLIYQLQLTLNLQTSVHIGGPMNHLIAKVCIG